MKFLEAMKAIQDGEKVRLTHWMDGLYIHAIDEELRDDKGKLYSITSVCKCFNWELFKEEELSQWAALESAPRDGTKVLGCEYHTKNIFIVSWDKEKKYFVVMDNPIFTGVIRAWAPIPKIPKEW